MREGNIVCPAPSHCSCFLFYYFIALFSSAPSFLSHTFFSDSRVDWGWTWAEWYNQCMILFSKTWELDSLKGLIAIQRLRQKLESFKTKKPSPFSISRPSTTLRAETFAGRNFRDFRDFDSFSRKLMPGKKLNEKFAKVIFAKNTLFQKSRKFFQSLKNWK